MEPLVLLSCDRLLIELHSITWLKRDAAGQLQLTILNACSIILGYLGSTFPFYSEDLAL